MLLTTGEFARGLCSLRAFTTPDAPLRIQVEVWNRIPGEFVLYNTHGQPDQPPFASAAFNGRRTVTYSDNRDRGGASVLVVGYLGIPPAQDVYRTTLRPDPRVRVVETRQPTAARNDPFFVADSQNAFYVVPRDEYLPIFDTPVYGLHLSKLPAFLTIPPVVVKTPELAIPPRPPWTEGTGLADSTSVELFVTQDAYIRQGLGTTGTITFHGKAIGPAGPITRSGNSQ
jgi:hypothetical protein